MKGKSRGKTSSRVPSKAQVAQTAVTQAMGLARANAGNLKSVKVKVKFGSGSGTSKPKRRKKSGSRGGY